ncbi:MAG: hypothetical protein ACPLW7_00230 [Minisyncoccia bacterium]|jgi:hypothetical protein
MKDKVDGVLIVSIYFPSFKGNFPNDCRRFLAQTLPRYLKDYTDKIEPLNYSLIRYIPMDAVLKENKNNKEEKKLRISGKAAGGQYTYIIKGATPEFFRKLFDFLEERKNRKIDEFLGNYNVILGNFISRGDLDEY